MQAPTQLSDFPRIYVVDTEYRQPNGENIDQHHCVVAQEIISGEFVSIWTGDEKLPCPLDLNNSLMVSWSNAEISFWLEMGWELPKYYIDLMTEYRNTISGTRDLGCSLIDALTKYKINDRSTPHKEVMRNRYIEGGPFTDEEKLEILEYCKEDVVSTAQLYDKIIVNKHFKVPFSLWRGEYMINTAKMKKRGIPIDKPLLEKMEKYNAELITKIIESSNDLGVYTPNWGSKKKEREGIEAGLPTPYSFRNKEFARVLRAKEATLYWPTTDKGSYSTDAGDCKGYIERFGLEDLFTCRQTVSQIKISSDPKKKRMIDVCGEDGRVRMFFNEFGSKTGRNQPSTKQNPFGVSAWMRSLIQPKEGMCLMYADFSGQEFAIAAALSNDQNMMDAYMSGDPHLGFGVRAGIIPEGSVVSSKPENEMTEEEKSIKKKRAQCKVVNLASMYGQQAQSISVKLNITEKEAADILKAHHKVFNRFWYWQGLEIEKAYELGYIRNKAGWTCQVDKGTSKLAIGNFPMQSNGVVMLQAAVKILEEVGVTVLCTVHDAILVECKIEEMEEIKATTISAMEEASKWLLNGFVCRVDVEKTICYPDRYVDGRGYKLWQMMCDFLSDKE